MEKLTKHQQVLEGNLSYSFFGAPSLFPLLACSITHLQPRGVLLVTVEPIPYVCITPSVASVVFIVSNNTIFAHNLQHLLLKFDTDLQNIF